MFVGCFVFVCFLFVVCFISLFSFLLFVAFDVFCMHVSVCFSGEGRDAMSTRTDTMIRKSLIVLLFYAKFVHNRTYDW